MGTSGIFPFFSLKKAKESQPKAREMKSHISAMKKDMHDYYLNRIIQLIEGSHIMGSGVINLEKIKGWYGYYGIDDTIVYYDYDMRDALLREGIASYNDSSGGLVITTEDYRVRQLKEKVDE